MHEAGKIEVISTAPVNDRDDLSMAYTSYQVEISGALLEI